MFLIDPYRFAAYDPDAADYISRVEAADGQSLESGVKDAVNALFIGCKADGIWNAIKASCILSGARTLAGALVPLVGTAPTNFNFQAGNYNRKTGLVGDGSTAYLSTNRTYAQLTQQNSGHFSCYITTDATTINKVYLGGYQTGGIFRDGAARLSGLVNSSTFTTELRTDLTTGFVGVCRNFSSYQFFRRAGTEVVLSSISTAPTSDVVNVFQNSPVVAGFNSAARLAFYSIGESLDLALLDARVTALVTALAIAIP